MRSRSDGPDSGPSATAVGTRAVVSPGQSWRRQMMRFTIVLVGISLLALATFGGDSPASPEISLAAASTRATVGASATAAPSILRDCPSLQRGDTDPVDGKNCVYELQKLLRDLHYDQPTTGRFFGKTEVNVEEFQRRHNIDAIGIVGPKTRAALLGDSSSATPLPAVQQSGYSICANQQCDLYLSRTNTRRYAKLITAHPFATSVTVTGIIVLACARFKLKIASLGCDGIASYTTDQLKHALQAAAAQNACLRTTFRLRATPQAPPLIFATDNSSRCKKTEVGGPWPRFLPSG
jgi:peptidoglycan hydrolase-like protein with peptidoglycan-binding domain